MNQSSQSSFVDTERLDTALSDLARGKSAWSRITPDAAIAILGEIKEALNGVMADWVELGSRARGLERGSRYEGEEWLSGPYALMSTCNALIDTLEGIEGNRFLDRLPLRTTATGQTAVNVVPYDIWDKLLISGIRADVWMEPGVTPDTLFETAASSWHTPASQRDGKVALVLGAGNISSIAPLDCFQKLFAEHQVVLLKLNPVNDYLKEVFETALAPLIRRDALRIVTGNGSVGEYLVTHPDVDEIHITGAGATHDQIVWGPGDIGAANKAAGTPRNTRRISSELGAISPTIVVPGPWSAADIRFQAQHIATHKMYNSGFNCLSCQVLVYSAQWAQAQPLLEAVENHMTNVDRPAYYPGAASRMQTLAAMGTRTTWLKRASCDDILITQLDDKNQAEAFEVFAPALSLKNIDETDPEAFLKQAIDYANASLDGTLSVGILIHPKTIRQIGQKRFEQLVGALRYGTIAVNSWTAAGFLLTRTPWGAFPGNTLDDIGSGIGQVHNTFMFERAERTIVTGPWRPFPRSFLGGEWTLLPKPPWFVTHKRAAQTCRALTEFQFKRRWRTLPRIAINALRG